MSGSLMLFARVAVVRQNRRKILDECRSADDVNQLFATSGAIRPTVWQVVSQVRGGRGWPRCALADGTHLPLTGFLRALALRPSSCDSDSFRRPGPGIAGKRANQWGRGLRTSSTAPGKRGKTLRRSVLGGLGCSY